MFSKNKIIMVGAALLLTSSISGWAAAPTPTVSSSPDPTDTKVSKASKRARENCWRDAQLLMQEAQAAAGEHEGNLADPDVEPLYDKAQRKQRECQNM